jgi:hypothetical protein
MTRGRWSQILHGALAMTLLLAASLACGHGPAQSQAAAPDREHEIISLCEDLKEPGDPAPCTKAAASDPAPAELHRLGCTRRETESCLAHAGELLAEGRRDDALKTYGEVCFFEKRVDACVAAANADTAEISTYLRNACDLGDAASCTKLHAKENARFDEARRHVVEVEKENAARDRSRAPANDASGGTTVTMQSANVNGLSIVSLSCSGVSGGMLAPITVTAALGERATALRACGVHGTIHVTWSAAGDAIDSVATTPANACIVSAMRASKLTMAKRCTADLAL